MDPKFGIRDVDLGEGYLGDIHVHDGRADHASERTLWNNNPVSFSQVDPEPLHEFTFFVDAETYMSYGGELDATEQDLHHLGIENVDIPRGYASDLGERIPIRVRATARGVKAYARLIHLHDPLQLEEMQRVISSCE